MPVTTTYGVPVPMVCVSGSFNFSIFHLFVYSCDLIHAVWFKLSVATSGSGKWPVRRVPQSGDTLVPVLSDSWRDWGLNTTGILGPALFGLQGFYCTGEWKKSPRGQAATWVKGGEIGTQILSPSDSFGVVEKQGKFPSIAGLFPCLHLELLACWFMVQCIFT